MKVDYSDLKRNVSSDLLGVGVSQGNQRKVLAVKESAFLEIPTGSKVKLRFVSFSKLEAGDYVIASTQTGPSVRRFVSVSFNDGCTRLVLVDGEGRQEEVPFTKLLGRIDEVIQGDVTFNPNPTNFLQRAGFRLLQTFSRSKPAA